MSAQQHRGTGAWTVVVSVAVVVVALLAIGTVVGWLVPGKGELRSHAIDVVVASATIATALGTLGLAVSTYYLAVKTRDVVDISREETVNARADLAVAQQQAATAEAALEAQTQPFLTVGDTGPYRLNAGTVHVRNAGNGTAVVTRAAFVAATGEVFAAAAKDPAIPPREGSSVSLPSGETAFEEASNFTVAIEFADVSGRPRGAVRLDVYRAGPVTPDGYGNLPLLRVRQVFWADTLEGVRENPTFGTQPYD